MRIDISKSGVDPQPLAGEVAAAQEKLDKGTGEGNDFIGWLHLPTETTDAFLDEIEAAAKPLRESCEVVVVVGIGGSYLGARAVIEALSHNFDHLLRERKTPVMLFAGQNIGEDYTADMLALLKQRSFGIVIISKSGTTTEPAIAFRLLKELLEQKVGKKEAGKRIIAITDASKGALRKLADQEGYKTFVIADNVGGRFSVLTPVGLVPIAIAGFDIRALVKGAQVMEGKTASSVAFGENPAAIYAATRNQLLRSGKNTEILINFEPRLHFFTEWWKQLYGESEGKNHKGIFPAGCDFTTDLHSMGQWIQDGQRIIYETGIKVAAQHQAVVIPTDDTNLDQLNYLAGKRVGEVNKMAELGTLLAHTDGGVPNITIEIDRLDEENLGELIYFFEKACGLSGYVLGVNPFNQPGVEAYKKNMFALLRKPGYEEASAAMDKRLAK